MTNATQGLPVKTPDPDFGRFYHHPGDTLPRLEMRLSRGWWLLPMLAGGISGWILLIGAVLF